MSVDVKKRLKDIEDELKLIEAENKLNSIKSNKTRSRSITVGTAFGGVCEISMRTDSGEPVYCLLQPVEVTELIHQLAGNIGCHLSLKPRNDFASWRNWQVTEEEKLHLNGHPPHPNDLITHQHIGAVLPPPEQQPGLQNVLLKEKNEEPLAIEKTVNKRKSKRTRKTT